MQCMIWTYALRTRGRWNHTKRQRRSLQASLLTKLSFVPVDFASFGQRAENERETAVFEANTAHSTAIVHQQQKTYTAEPATHEKVITDLRLQLKAAQSQSEIAEPQRQAALEQYMIASNEAKSLSGVNRALNQRVGTLEKQLTTGLTQWRHGHETNPRRNEQKLKRL
ncbi:hypothetical protein FRC12_006434 [Ceratobasidium sp. 428]|nr:hypothetical protein FRC12_006434 [Ceratobasidium sp. 428]